MLTLLYSQCCAGLSFEWLYLLILCGHPPGSLVTLVLHEIENSELADKYRSRVDQTLTPILHA